MNVSEAIKTLGAALIFASIFFFLMISIEFGAPFKLAVAYLLLGEFGVVALLVGDVWEHRKK